MSRTRPPTFTTPSPDAGEPTGLDIRCSPQWRRRSDVRIASGPVTGWPLGMNQVCDALAIAIDCQR
jgi:hypothetical protein